MLFAYKTDKGLKREKNEDSVYADGRLFIIADGMGGHNAGEVASSMAVKVISERLKTVTDNFREEISDAVAFANESIFSSAGGEYSGMGTTVDICLYDGEKIHVGHVGDSRVYLLRKGKMKKLTLDHSYVEMLFRKGEITREQADNYPMKNMITRAVGVGEDVTADCFEAEVEPGDMFLMCTDGLTNVVTEERILEVINSASNIDEVPGLLIKQANENGGPDNITVIIAVCD